MKQTLLITITLVFTSLLLAQTKEEIETVEFFWGEHDTYKTSVDIPEKWQNESAVIIYKNENYDFHKFGKSVTYKESIRKRIKLLDKAAVEEFSEFSYKKRFHTSKGHEVKKIGNNIIGVKIIKPDGSELIIDMDKDAVQVDGETKIAIANLEVGDIIDFYAYSIEPFKSTFAFGFDPVERTLSEEYPIMDYKLYFKTEDDFFINFKSFNNAPELLEMPSDKKNTRHYELTAQNIDKHKIERWFYPLVELPAYKFQVYFARSGKFEKQASAFLSEKANIIKTDVSTEEIIEAYDDIFPYGGIASENQFLKKKTFSNDAEKVTAIYYFMRHHYLTRFIEAFIIKEADIIFDPFGVYGIKASLFDNETEFIRNYLEILKANNIKCDLIVGKKRFDGSVDDLLIKKNLNLVVKTKTTPPVYINFIGIHSTVNTINPYLEGTDAYLLSGEKWIYDSSERITIPMSTCENNKNTKEITVNLLDDFNSMSLTSEVSYTGHEKKDEQYDRLIFKDYIDEDHEKFKTKSYVELLKKNEQEKIKQQLDNVIEKLKEKQKETFKTKAQNGYDITNIEDYTYTINETGRYLIEDPFTFTEEFTIKDELVKKAGPNYIIEIGRLIGGQVDLTAVERERIENIYTQYPRSFNYQINFNIPEGYTVSGLEKLNKSVDNKTGAFISTAVLEKNTLIINTTKQYKNNYESNADWQLMMDFLDEAHQFTNEKILLKKG